MSDLGPLWLFSCGIAALGCLGTADVPPVRLPRGHPRIVTAKVLLFLGFLGLALDAIF